MQWLQSGIRQAELFDRIFARQGPGFVRSLSPLVMLSVAAAITTSFESFPVEYLQWLENILLAMDPLVSVLRFAGLPLAYHRRADTFIASGSS
jgi:hypothetical protein